jgi:DNA invertase Pin-like site-specific DNA recombinase
MKKRNEVAANSAVGYIRVSTIQQTVSGVSLEAQDERLRAYCQMTGLVLTDILREESVSASVPLFERAAGAELLAVLKRDACHVVTLKLDRLFRDAEDALRQTRAWDREGVSLHLVDFNGASINSSTAMGRMMLTMLAGFAEFERNLIAERTTAALEHKKTHLQVFNHEPFGYRRDGKALIPMADEQTVIARVKTLRRSGSTLADIAITLNTDGIPTKRAGGRWYPSTVRNLLESTMHA